MAWLVEEGTSEVYRKEIEKTLGLDISGRPGKKLTLEIPGKYIVLLQYQNVYW